MQTQTLHVDSHTLKTMTQVLLTALRDRERVCRMSSMVFRTRPLHNKWGNLQEEQKLCWLYWTWAQTVSQTVSLRVLLRFSQARQVLVSHSADPLVDVVKVDQQELGVAFELLLVGFGFCLMNRPVIKNPNMITGRWEMSFWWREEFSLFLPSSVGRPQKPCHWQRSHTASYLSGKTHIEHYKHDNKNKKQKKKTQSMLELIVVFSPDLSFWMALSSKYRNMTWNRSESRERSILK